MSHSSIRCGWVSARQIFSGGKGTARRVVYEEVEGPTLNKAPTLLAVALVATAVVTTLLSAAAETIVDCLIGLHPVL
jgi:hypothetical protein